MKAEIVNDELVIHIPINDPPKASKSGKTVVLASSYGNQQIEIDGCMYWIGINCYTYPDMLKEAQESKTKQKGKG